MSKTEIQWCVRWPDSTTAFDIGEASAKEIAKGDEDAKLIYSKDDGNTWLVA